MRTVFWFLFLAASAVALAMLMGDNQATVLVFWPPYRVDLSFNLVLFTLVGGFVLLYLALRGLALLRELPQQAQRWRRAQLERAVYAQLLDAVAYQLSGRFVRARSAAEQSLELMRQVGDDAVIHRAQMQVLANLVAAESAHAVGDTDRREAFLLAAVAHSASSDATPAREGALLRAATWALKDRDADEAQRWLAELPQGVSRRIQAVRLRLKLAQLRRDTHGAIEMVRLLTKHRAYTREAGDSVLRGLLLDALRDTHDHEQMLGYWQRLDADERHNPDIALAWLERWAQLCSEGLATALAADQIAPEQQRTVLDALRQVWSRYGDLSEQRRRRLIVWLEPALPALGADWLAQVEQAQRARPSDAGLQYLAGQAFMQRQLWGKAAFLLEQATRSLTDAHMIRRAWCSLAQLAEERGDEPAALAAWKRAALS